MMNKCALNTYQIIGLACLDTRQFSDGTTFFRGEAFLTVRHSEPHCMCSVHCSAPWTIHANGWRRLAAGLHALQPHPQMAAGLHALQPGPTTL
eukprot:363941-Chlamydomonas_euryale.AAC.4